MKKLTKIKVAKNSSVDTSRRNKIYLFATIFIVWLVWSTVNEIKQREMIPKLVEVFEVNSPAIDGQVSLTGYLRFDPSPTSVAKYFLVLDDGRSVIVDSTSKYFNPSLVDQQIILEGTAIQLIESGYDGFIIPLVMNTK